MGWVGPGHHGMVQWSGVITKLRIYCGDSWVTPWDTKKLTKILHDYGVESELESDPEHAEIECLN